MPEKKEATKLEITLSIAFVTVAATFGGYSMYLAGSFGYTQLDNMLHKGEKKELCDKKNAELVDKYKSEISTLTNDFPGEGKVQVGMRYIISESESPHWRKTYNQRRCGFVGLQNYDKD